MPLTPFPLMWSFISRNTENSQRGNSISIQCKEPAHYFRGLNWALHHLSEEKAEKTETVCFPRDGLMLDCSRNAVFTVDTVKELIRKLARMG